MAIVLVLLAVGSVAAGYVGLPNAIVHGGNRIGAFLEPSFRAPTVVDLQESRLPRSTTPPPSSR